MNSDQVISKASRYNNLRVRVSILSFPIFAYSILLLLPIFNVVCKHGFRRFAAQVFFADDETSPCRRSRTVLPPLPGS